jgi:hypothetical protein
MAPEILQQQPFIAASAAPERWAAQSDSLANFAYQRCRNIQLTKMMV